MLDNAEQQHEDAEQDRLVEHRDNERLVIEPSAKAEHSADQDDLGDDQCLDQRNSPVKIGDAHLGEDQPSVHRERAQEYPEVESADREDPELLERPALEPGGTGGFLSFHRFGPPENSRSRHVNRLARIAGPAPAARVMANYRALLLSWTIKRSLAKREELWATLLRGGNH